MPFEHPLILGFDTSAAHCAAALLSGDRIVSATAEQMHTGQAERLMVLLEDVLTAANARWSDLNAIGVGVGPGNFTGIRISVAAARGLSLALGVPAVGVSNFEAAVYNEERPATALVSAPRDQVYRQDFSPEGMRAPMVQPRGVASAEARALGHNIVELPEPDLLIGNIARLAAQRWQDTSVPPAPLYVRAADAAPPKDAPPVMLES